MRRLGVVVAEGRSRRGLLPLQQICEEGAPGPPATPPRCSSSSMCQPAKRSEHGTRHWSFTLIALPCRPSTAAGAAKEYLDALPIALQYIHFPQIIREIQGTLVWGAPFTPQGTRV
jgi:hypothetical protein